MPMAPCPFDAGGPGHFWMLRHGERIDETDAGQAWKEATPRERRFDPPLTANGKQQARSAAGVLTGHGFRRIFSSPLQRCLETAFEVAQLLDLPVTVLPGLGECCAAAGRRKGLDGLLSREDMRRVCPRIDVFGDSAPKTFEAACAWLAQSTGAVLAVSHREGICALSGEPLRLPYCAIGHFRFHHTAPHGAAWSIQELFDHAGKDAGAAARAYPALRYIKGLLKTFGRSFRRGAASEAADAGASTPDDTTADRPSNTSTEAATKAPTQATDAPDEPPRR
ncbi:histidine phosphatase superfamily [Pelagophyceae sp. CCMP2097]|nr:histidine phosphatase superfamily [Pelagophyceae sp. CCMP2097]